MEKDQSLLVFTILLSIAIHILLGLGSQHFGKAFPQTSPQDIEVVYTQAPQKKIEKKQVVSDLEQLEEKVNQLQKAVTRLSKKNLRVSEESVASRTANKTVNRSPTPSQRSTPQEKSKRNRGPGRKLSPSPLNPQRVSGFSTSSDYIPNVKIGSATALNADQFTYYTYFERIKSQLRPRWVNRIRRSVALLSPTDLRSLSHTTQYTEIEVILDSAGFLKDIILVRASDSKGLDEAALQSFEEISPILNPPEGMIGDDGLIRIYYSFNVQLAPRPYVRNP
ncbi:MAG: hypothetical protein CL677_04535 [Bdellovibrionaceae bacterium]|nr:hypothetical protein [Pseudobdellovibrionaceae bacterium]|tara:strand:+ start:66316 stop:67152 length:837 start_codon:yes stop_codon:yes gene_type:complete